jgi:ABC-type transport system involved in cytochrome c biogenesis permease subunit
VTRYAKFFPVAVVAVFALYALGKAYPRPETYKEMNLSSVGELPVLDSGRVKPLDSFARTSLLYISGRSDFEDANGDKQPAIRWLMDVMAFEDPNASPGADHRVFRVDNEQLLYLFGLDTREGLRYSWNELRKKYDKFEAAFEKAKQMDEKKLDLFNSKVLELARRLRVYEQIAMGRTPTVAPKEQGSKEWVSLSEVDQTLFARISDADKERARAEATREVDAVLRQNGQDPSSLRPEVQARRNQIIDQMMVHRLVEGSRSRRGEVSPPAGAFADILAAYRDNKPKAFAEAVTKYRTEFAYPLNPEFRDTTRFETAFNAAAPFYLSAILYIFAGVFAFLSWIGWSEPFRRAGVGLATMAVLLHVAGLLGRMYLMGRPLVFVTNLYSSALLIGCGAVAVCLLIEWAYKNGVALVVGTVLGATTVKIAHHLSTDGNDTLGTLVAVLDTNFWLASHVTTITMGYAATYIAGLMGVVYIVWGLFFTTLSKEKHVTLGKMTYGVTCFALLLSFVGTVLGGIWADQSWGRFWGWDPKENGAVLIVIWNALILHARWGGMVKQRGLAVLAVVGIMVTTWSWFGTNQLGVGLHNYGFNKTLAEGCMYTWIVSASVIAAGLIPLPYWRSYAALTNPAPPAPPAKDEPVVPVVTDAPAPTPQPAENGHQNGHAPRPGGKKARRR